MVWVSQDLLSLGFGCGGLGAWGLAVYGSGLRSLAWAKGVLVSQAGP